MKVNHQRIWELDALRGISILGVIGLHLLFDLEVFFGLPFLQHPLMQLYNKAVGIFFVVLSGLCVTLGKRPIRRGLQVFGFAMIITAVTWVMAKLGFLHPSLIIWFGVLHLLGLCMLLWPLFQKSPTVLLAALSAAILVLGFYFDTVTVSIPWLFPLGLTSKGFTSGDFFPLFPFLGWFFLGAVLGRTVYKNKQSLLSAFPYRFPFLCWCGRHSLLLYLLHQPILYGIIQLFV